MNNRRIMIRFVAFFVCVVMIISGNIYIITTYASSSDGNQSNDEEYYTIKTVVTDYNEKHNLRLMTQNGHVYAEASVLAQLLGFTFRANKDKFSVMNREDDSLPKITCYFTHNSNDVIRNVSLDHYTYKAPFECIVNKNGYWVPFEYTIYLMNSSLVILDDYVFLERPHKNCIDIMYDEAINKNQYFYDFYNPEVGDTMETLSDWSRIVNVFDGLLTFDGYSWLQYVQSFTGFSKAYDTKYGREVALLMCTVSEDERDTIYQKIGDYSESMDVSSDTTSAFFDGLNDHLAKLDTKQNLGELNWAKTVFNNNNSLASANEAYRYMTEAQDRRKLAHLIGEDFATETYDKLSIEIGDLKFGPADYIKVFAGVVQGISYMYQFQHQDDFSRNALNTMLGDSFFEKGVLPQATVEGMSKMVDELDSNIAKYSTYNYIRNNVLNTFKDFINLPKLIGKPGSTLLLGWSLARKLVPFYNEGLSSTHNMEIATYSYVFQKSAFSNYKNLYYKTFNSDSLGTITSQELYPVVQYLYDYLKAGFVSRDAYIGMQTEADLKEFSSYIDKLKSDNQRIAEALIILKDATDTNDYYKSFGILPSENEAFLKKLNDEIIIDFLKSLEIASESSNTNVENFDEKDLRNMDSIAESVIYHCIETEIDSWKPDIDNAEFFWDVMCFYSNLEYADFVFPQSDGYHIVPDHVLVNASYACFESFDGILPNIADNIWRAKYYDSDSKLLVIGDSGIKEIRLMSYEINKDKSVDATYSILFWGEEEEVPSSFYKIHYIRNPHCNDIDSKSKYYFTVDNVTRISESEIELGTHDEEKHKEEQVQSDIVDIRDSVLKNAVQETLNIGDRDITETDALQLTALECYAFDDYNVVKDISGISAFKNLTSLDLGGNEIKDISELESLTKLTYLDLSGNKISDIRSLSHLKELSYLDLSGNEINEISEISNLINLTYLNLDGNELDNISCLSGLTNLTTLDLSLTGLSDITDLSGLTSLTELTLVSNYITDISGLTGLTNMTSLNLCDNQIDDIRPLSKMKKLTTLYLTYNEIDDIEAVSDLINLESLWLGSNLISDISPLAKLTNLVSLDLSNYPYGDYSNNQITDISALSGLTKLKQLSLSGNPVLDIYSREEIMTELSGAQDLDITF